MRRYEQDYTKTAECSKNHHAFAKLDDIMNYIYINEKVKINSEPQATVLVSWYYSLFQYIWICDDIDKIIPKLQGKGEKHHWALDHQRTAPSIKII
jgi:hypothetical protein